MISLDGVQVRNYMASRRIYDAWFDAKDRGYEREAGWVRLVGALDTESKCRILAHGGGWDGGNRTNSSQRAVLAESARLYREATGRDPDGFGNNGASVGPLQQIPTDAARLRTKDGLDGGAPQPWDGWGGIVECMVLETCLPKYLAQLRVTTNKFYGRKPMADLVDGAEIVADLLRVQQPAENEVAANYGADIVQRAQAIAALFPTTPAPWWPRWFTGKES